MGKCKKTQEPEQNYFTSLLARVDELDLLAEPYLKGRPEKSLHDLWIDNTELGYAWLRRCDDDFDAVPEVVASIGDGHTPFYISRNGSLLYLLGLSLKSLEAHAWALNDFLRGKSDSYELPFEIVAEVQVGN